ncbi:MAG: AAA family ATPase [Anaerolineales bacterium]|nr:AAA family ATPase [Anaerolineales bacterium]
MAPNRNPYIAGTPVGNKITFIGRDDILRETKRVLQDVNQNAITLFGQRRIGKTSILQYLTKHLSEEGSFDTVFFDLEDRAAKPLGQVVVELAKTIARELHLPEPNLGKNPDQNFRDVWLPQILNEIQHKVKAGKAKPVRSLVLLFDEFDVLADPQAGTAAKEFFPYLRSLLSLDRSRLQFVFTLGRNLGDLSQVAISLFKGVPDKRVSLLSKIDTESLIRFSEKNNSLKWSQDAVEKVWSLTNGHPFLTQALCWEIWQKFYEGASKKDSSIVLANEIDEAINSTLERSRNALDWLWQGLGPAEKVVAAALAQAGTGPVTQDEIEHILNESGIVIIIRELSEEAPKRLQEWDLIEPVNGGYRFRVELLRFWIAEHYPLSLVQRELDAVQPAAEGLYQAARSVYQVNLNAAKLHLIQAIDYNPNHRGASELLAEIYIVDGEVDKAQALLEKLMNAYPSIARPRLIQVYLKQAEGVSSDDEKLVWYQKILKISPNQLVAQTAVNEIWSARGEASLKSGDLKNALAAFGKANDKTRKVEVQNLLREIEIQKVLSDIEKLEGENQFEEALELTFKFEKKYKGAYNWDKLKERLKAKGQLADIYQQALGAIAQNDLQKATHLLLEVLNIQPDYEMAAFHLNQVVADASKKKEKKETILPNQISITEANSDDVGKTSTQSKGTKLLNPTNPFDFVRFIVWIFFTPNRRRDYIQKYGEDAEAYHAKWIVSILMALPLIYLPIGQFLGLVSTNGILNIYPNILKWSLICTIGTWIWLGVSKSINEDDNIIKFIFFSTGLSLTIAITNSNLALLYLITLITIIASSKGMSMVVSRTYNTISALLSIPLLISLLFIVWYVSTVSFSGLLGIIIGGITFIVVGIVLYIGVIFLGIILSSIIGEEPSYQKSPLLSTIWLVILHGLIIWVSFFDGLQKLNSFLQ